MYKFIYTDHRAKDGIVFETVAPDILTADKRINESLGIDISKCGWIGCRIIKEDAMETVTLTRDEAIEQLAENEYEMLDDMDIVNILIEGCPGWNTLAASDFGLKTYFFKNFGKKLVISQKTEIRKC